MKTLILFFSMFQNRDTVPDLIVYRDMTIKTMKGYSYVDAFGKKKFLTSTKKSINPNYLVEYPSQQPPIDTLKSGYGIIIDTVSPHKFSIRIDTTLFKK